MEQFVNQVLAKLDGRISASELTIVGDALYYVLQNWDVSVKETRIVPYEFDVPQEVKEYLVAKKIAGLSDRSLKQYYNSLKRFFTTVRKPATDIKTNDCRLFLYQIQKENNMSNLSLNNQREYLNAFFKWLNENEYIDRNPCSKIPKFKYELKERKPLTDVEMEKLRKACKTDRDKAIIEVFYSTGCRVEELSRLTIDDIDFSEREVHLFGKGNKHRTSYLNAKAIVALVTLLNNRSKILTTNHVFISQRAPYEQLSVRQIEKIVTRLGEQAGIQDRVFPHRIRHTTATDALHHGMPIDQIQMMLGHEKIDTTIKYAKTDLSNVKASAQKHII